MKQDKGEKGMREIKPLLENYLEIVHSKQNQENKKYWEMTLKMYLLGMNRLSKDFLEE